MSTGTTQVHVHYTHNTVNQQFNHLAGTSPHSSSSSSSPAILHIRCHCSVQSDGICIKCSSQENSHLDDSHGSGTRMKRFAQIGIIRSRNYNLINIQKSDGVAVYSVREP